MCISGDTTMQDNIKLATRKSPLALEQADIVKKHLLEKGIFKKIEIVSMSTSGDTVDDSTFKSQGGKGLFLKELEIALLDGKADIAVHSMKDVPAKLDGKFWVTSIMKREDPRDAFISNIHDNIESLNNAVKGSSSPRRRAIISNLKQKIEVVEVRGNINTRLKKLDDDKLDGIVLAIAGLHRMNMGHLITQSLSTDVFVPAPGQGILCLECLSDNRVIMNKIKKIIDKKTEICSHAERIFAASMDGDCQSPIGAYAEISGITMSLTGFVASVKGDVYIKNRVEGPIKDFVKISEKLSKLFIKMGSKDILKC